MRLKDLRPAMRLVGTIVEMDGDRHLSIACGLSEEGLLRQLEGDARHFVEECGYWVVISINAVCAHCAGTGRVTWGKFGQQRDCPAHTYTEALRLKQFTK